MNDESAILRDVSSDGGSSATSPSLLLRARNHDRLAWRRLADLYGPLVVRWVRLARIHGDDADDIFQEVFRTLLDRLPEFQTVDHPGGFRRWLRSMTRNKIGDHLRRLRRDKRTVGLDPETAADAEAALAAEPSDDEDESERRAVLQRFLEMVEKDFQPKTWEAFRMTALDGRKADDVARELGLTRGAVYLAKYHVIQRLRQEMSGLL